MNAKILVVGMIDIEHRPNVYRTNNPGHYGRLCIDFYPETVPTIASFATTEEVSSWLKSRFGVEQFDLWFPDGLYEVENN